MSAQVKQLYSMAQTMFKTMITMNRETYDLCESLSGEMTIEQMCEHIKNECDEVVGALKSDDPHDVYEEMGDVIYNVLRLCFLVSRKYPAFDAWEAWARTATKVTARFQIVQMAAEKAMMWEKSHGPINRSFFTGAMKEAKILVRAQMAIMDAEDALKK